MTFRRSPLRFLLVVLLCLAGTVWTVRTLKAFATPPAPVVNQQTFDDKIKPFFKQNCMNCHNSETGIAGVRVDTLTPAFEDRHLALWESVARRINNGSMPPKGLPQPSVEDRKLVADWINTGLEAAKQRPTPKNGINRRLTVSQYRNTLKELLQLEDDLAGGLPPDAISKDGFVNNTETLQLSPMLVEAYFEIAEEALKRAIVDPKEPPSIQDFRMDLGTSVNPRPLKEKLILGAGSALLENKDFVVSQPIPVKPFAFNPIHMRTKWRFIEGYQGNDTVRGWREYDSIYHNVFADMRGSGGYPKGRAYSLVPQGLLLRPAIPNDEIFGSDGTFGPKANFKISLRELPNSGRFRVTVMAAKYNDGLLLDTGVKPLSKPETITVTNVDSKQTVNIPQAGLYQIDVIAAAKVSTPPQPDATHISEGLAAAWLPSGPPATAKLEGKAKLIDSPFGKAVTLSADGDHAQIPRTAAMNTGDGDFTIAAWIKPSALRKATILSLGGKGDQGWYLEASDNKGAIRFQTNSEANDSNGSVASQGGTLKAKTWQQVSVVIRRAKKEAVLYVNGYPVGRGEIDNANLDNPKANLIIGDQFRGDLGDIRFYNRALAHAEVQALVFPGKEFVTAPPAERPQDVTLTLGGRQFINTLKHPAFLAVRLEAGPLDFEQHHTGVTAIEKVNITPLPTESEITPKFLAFEKRAPKLGVHLGFRRDCGSTFAPVGAPVVVGDTKLTKFVFEGAMRNYPNPDVEKDNVNYLAGVREIAVRSEYTDGRDMPRLMIHSVEFEGPYYETWPPVSHKNIFVDSPKKSDPNAYAQQILHNFTAKAYRRPVTPAEDASIFAVYKKSAASGRNFQDSVKDALQVVLTSPQFLFITEKSKTPEPEPLDSYELASKLSYFLWNGPPDRKTLQLAANGTLRKQLDAEVERMIADERFKRFTTEFTSQWLALDKFAVLEPDRKKFPALTRDTRAQLKLEPIQTVQYLIRHNLPVKDLVSADFIVANETVANYYDLGSKTESGFEFIAIPHGRKELGGVLTEAAIMAGLSDGRESNPVKRGAWLARKIISEPPADPPPNVPTVKEDPNLTLRQRLEQHRNQNGCKQCHAKIDPWGVAMEEFDAGGRLKSVHADASSTLPDNTKVEGANDLKRYLAEDRIDQVAYSVLKNLETYATGHTLTVYEQTNLKKDALKLKAGGYRMKDMIRYVANSSLFLEK